MGDVYTFTNHDGDIWSDTMGYNTVIRIPQSVPWSSCVLLQMWWNPNTLGICLPLLKKDWRTSSAYVPTRKAMVARKICWLDQKDGTFFNQTSSSGYLFFPFFAGSSCTLHFPILSLTVHLLGELGNSYMGSLSALVSPKTKRKKPNKPF